ncbi:transcription antitermination protein NusG [Fulvitalea axinellae]|uniref:Transcription antitermination protein NusG n=1 Tax=Fulvitalea axinellae TaxID=1182444 RepID=A0AAU9CL78_9BACT|nr:transcription antitermination protein NusG [Fulvitalea axinellae]
MSFRKAWYVLYTKSRSEKKVAERLAREGFDVFFPTKKELRQWSDRKKMVEVPLFNSYVFIHLNDDREYLAALQDKGVSWFVYHENRPAILPDSQMEFIRRMAGDEKVIEVLDASDIKPGERVMIEFGPFADCEGEVMDHQGARRVMVRLETLGQAVVVDIPVENLKVVSETASVD